MPAATAFHGSDGDVAIPMLNESGQSAYYGRVGGCIVTGNEDGIKHCTMNLLYSHFARMLRDHPSTYPPEAA